MDLTKAVFIMTSSLILSVSGVQACSSICGTPDACPDQSPPVNPPGVCLSAITFSDCSILNGSKTKYVKTGLCDMEMICYVQATHVYDGVICSPAPAPTIPAGPPPSPSPAACAPIGSAAIGGLYAYVDYPGVCCSGTVDSEGNYFNCLAPTPPPPDPVVTSPPPVVVAPPVPDPVVVTPPPSSVVPVYLLPNPGQGHVRLQMRGLR